MLTRTWFPAALAVTASLAAVPAAAQPATKENREFLATLVKERLDDELTKFEIKAATSGRHTTRWKNFIKDIVIHTDWTVTVNGRFVEPVKRSVVEVTRLDPQPDGSKLVTLVATAPIAGDIWGEVRTVGKTKVDFDSKARLELHGKVKRKAGKAGDDGEFEAEVNEWKGEFDDVRLRPDLAGILSGEARKAGNKAIADKNDGLKAAANSALARAATAGRLRLDP